MSNKATIEYEGQKLELDVIVGTENEVGLDITSLRAKTGMITLDPGYGNTGSCTSDITFIDGEKGILRHRGYAIEELAEKSTFMETAFLVLYGHLPNASELVKFEQEIGDESYLHYGMKSHFEGFPDNAPPMAVLSAMLNTLACYNTDLLTTATEGEAFTLPAAKIISKVRAIAAWAYRTSIGKPFMAPRPDLSYSGNFLHLMFSQQFNLYEPLPEVEKALDLFFILHADHEQNCSTSTVRMVGSSHASLFSAVSAGVGALWGPLHGGANCEVIKMLTHIHEDGIKPRDFVEKAKDKNSPEKLMGFGHRVYKSFDPRAKILKGQVDNVLKAMNVSDPLLDIAYELEEMARSEDYFIERNLYPNVDFYSGILLRAIGIPVNMFTVLFAIGRMPGWIANWREMHEQSLRISRPRQIYTGEPLRSYVPMQQR
ncbi:citrate synthase [Pontiella sulfatireligans]|uniref:Citrate synthase n=1 Tax=Pontiella sulfatireligans TaxID=2750658 RepID=A0A6C2URP6_9BACT|nr:citrate synthase [Pontiella sulfatireligans]VGO21606.1 Citrate synthase 1 [Pontiella sulfatireligans]